ncbi:MAG: alpha/beta hydrolase family esterase [Acidobacteriota bacterium]
MRRLITIFCGLLFMGLALAIPAEAQKISKENIESQGKSRTYYLLVPEKPTKENPAPLLVVLHGSNRNGLSLVEKWKDLAVKEGIFLVGPDAIDSGSWNIPQDGPDFLHDLISDLNAKYPIDRRRIYLFGHSAGAVFALYMSLHESEYFAATAIHAGLLPREAYPAIDLAKRKIPIYIVVGTVDPFFPLGGVRATRDALNQQGFAVQLTEIKGHDHWYYDLAPKINADAWAFLKQQKLTDDPRYTHYTFK